MNENSQERKHHPFSPSTLQAREGCPKYTPRSGETNQQAETGTRQHNAVETQLDDPKLADYRAAAVAECIAFAEKRFSLYPGGQFLREAYLPIDEEWVCIEEESGRVTASSLLAKSRWQEDKRGKARVERGTTAGYSDVSLISACLTRGEIIDWKFGNNAVEDAETNLQGIAYALGLLKAYPKMKEITVWFIMPHQDFVTTHTFTIDDFGNMMLRVRTVVARAHEAHLEPEDFSMATPNMSSCLFCGLIGKCPKVAEIALKVGKKYRPLEIPETVTPTLVKDAKDVGIGLKLAGILATWAEAFRRQATAKTVENEKFIPDGYVLVEQQKRIVAKAKNLGEIAKRFLPPEQHKLVDELYDVPIGKLEELISTFADRGSKDATKKEFGEVALNEGALELGNAFSFLRQERKQDKSKTAES